jgi:hypothetical protein
MIANHIHESAQAFRLAQAAVLLQNREDTGKGLLAYVFYRMRGLQAGTQLELEQFRKIADKMFLCLPVTGTETIDVTCIEGVKLQSVLRQAERIYV